MSLAAGGQSGCKKGSGQRGLALERVDRLKEAESPIDFSTVTPVIGILGGDGIGLFIAAESQRLLEHLMQLNYLGEEYARGVPYYLYQN